MSSAWGYEIAGEVVRFPATEIEKPAAMHYFTRAEDEGYSFSGVLRSMALYVDKLPEYDTVEAAFIYPESHREGWAGMVAIYHDTPPTLSIEDLNEKDIAA